MVSLEESRNWLSVSIICLVNSTYPDEYWEETEGYRGSNIWVAVVTSRLPAEAPLVGEAREWDEEEEREQTWRKSRTTQTSSSEISGESNLRARDPQKQTASWCLMRETAGSKTRTPGFLGK